MNLQKLFKAQKELDDRINKEKGLEGQDLLGKKILALLVELGELANEERSWKFWSENREPNKGRLVGIECWWCDGEGFEPGGLPEKCHECGGTGEIGTERTSNPLLEEYADCLHFILSIGNDLGNEDATFEIEKSEYIVIQYLSVYNMAVYLFKYPGSEGTFENLLSIFLGLGELLGFTWKQIEQAYFEKRETNFKRQEQGY